MQVKPENEAAENDSWFAWMQVKPENEAAENDSIKKWGEIERTQGDTEPTGGQIE